MLVTPRDFSGAVARPHKDQSNTGIERMRRPLRLFFRTLSLFLGVALVMPGALAATSQSGGYTRIAVPDLAQAATFFENVLDCEPVGQIPPASPAASARRVTGSTLLICDSGSVVELFVPAANDRATVGNPRAHAVAPVELYASDAAHADEWLRRAGVKVTGNARLVSTGPHAGQVVVGFLSPWGQPMRLVSWNTANTTASP